MKNAVKELQKLSGVGEVLAKRFVDAGLDSFAKVAAAGEEALQKISGINRRTVPAIIAQAEELSRQGKQNAEAAADELRRRTLALKEEVQKVAVGVRERFADELAGKKGKKVEKAIVRLFSALENVEASLGRKPKPKRTARGLKGAEKRVASLSDASLAKVAKGLKKGRKSLESVFS